MSSIDWIIKTFASFYLIHWIWVMVGAFICKTSKETKNIQKIGLPSLCVVIPIFNEKNKIFLIQKNINVAHSIGASVIIVDDGSNDGSSTLIDSLIQENVKVVRHQNNCGKAAALRSAFETSDAEVVLTIDADTVIIEPEIILKGIGYFCNSNLAALAIRIDAKTGNILEKSQELEYQHVLDFERRSFSVWGQIFTIPGAASFWRRKSVIEVGSFSDRTLAEDTDLTLRLRRENYSIKVADNLYALTLCPYTLNILIRQRMRWIWGTIQASTINLRDWFFDGVNIKGISLLLFFLMVIMNILGYIIAILIIFRFVIIGPTKEDLLLMFFLTILTIIRLKISKKYYADSTGYGILLFHLFLVQSINFIAFWYGLISGKAFQKTWHH